MINKVTLVGRLGKDPEVKYLEGQNGKFAIATFTLATNEKVKDKTGNWVDQTEWHNISMIGKVAEIAEKYLKKGSLVYLEGKIQTRTYEKDGQKKYFTEVKAYEMKMLDGKEKSTSGDSGSFAQQTDSIPADVSMDSAPADDLPF